MPRVLPFHSGWCVLCNCLVETRIARTGKLLECFHLDCDVTFLPGSPLFGPFPSARAAWVSSH